MTQPDKPRYAPMNDHRQNLINAAPCDSMPPIRSMPLIRSILAATQIQHSIECKFTPCRLEHCWHRPRMLYTSPRIYSFAREASTYQAGSPRPRLIRRASAWRYWQDMDRNWLEQYPPGVPADIDPDRYASLREIFEEACIAHRHSPAFTNMGATLSYTQLDELSRAFAAWLQKKSGLVPGDRVALMMPNILQYPIALFGALRAGMVVVNTNPLYTARELEHQLKDSGAKAIVIVENFVHVLQQVLARTNLKNVLVTGVDDLLGMPKGLIVNFVLRHVRKQVPDWSIPGSVSFKTALGSGLGLKMQPVSLGGEDIAFLQYTGGTTGVAKAAVLTHRNMVANLLQSLAWIRPALQAGGGRIRSNSLPPDHHFSPPRKFLWVPPLGGRNH